jgi:hyperosmotically inducible protein
MEMNVRNQKRTPLRRSSSELGMAVLALCAGVMLTGQFTQPIFAVGNQGSTDSKLAVKPQTELPPSQLPAQQSKPGQPKTQISKTEESKAKKDNDEEGAEREKEGTGKKAVSSLILTVKLALMEDPRLFPYEIEVEAGSYEITLAGKVSTEIEKVAAAKIAGAVPAVKSVVNKLEVVKELPEILAHKQDDIITRHVRERLAKSATVTAANFDVKTEQGVVSLSGTVRFQVIVLEAAEAAREIPGVKAVRTDKVRIESEG